MTILVAAFFNGLTLSLLWGWFITPYIGLPDIGLVPAIGIGMIIRYLTHENNGNSNNESWVTVIVSAIVSPLIVLSLGWILTWFL
jgi:uncharacterized membrane protein YhdT